MHMNRSRSWDEGTLLLAWCEEDLSFSTTRLHAVEKLSRWEMERQGKTKRILSFFHSFTVKTRKRKRSERRERGEKSREWFGEWKRNSQDVKEEKRSLASFSLSLQSREEKQIHEEKRKKKKRRPGHLSLSSQGDVLLVMKKGNISTKWGGRSIDGKTRIRWGKRKAREERERRRKRREKTGRRFTGVCPNPFLSLSSISLVISFYLSLHLDLLSLLISSSPFSSSFSSSIWLKSSTSFFELPGVAVLLAITFDLFFFFLCWIEETSSWANRRKDRRGRNKGKERKEKRNLFFPWRREATDPDEGWVENKNQDFWEGTFCDDYPCLIHRTESFEGGRPFSSLGIIQSCSLSFFLLSLVSSFPDAFLHSLGLLPLRHYMSITRSLIVWERFLERTLALFRELLILPLPLHHHQGCLSCVNRSIERSPRRRGYGGEQVGGLQPSRPLVRTSPPSRQPSRRGGFNRSTSRGERSEWKRDRPWMRVGLSSLSLLLLLGLLGLQRLSNNNNNNN